MADNLDLVVEIEPDNAAAEFRLLDGKGSQLAYQRCDFAAMPVSRQQGLFDLRNYIESYVEAGDEETAVAEIGVCIARDVFGEEIFSRLWEPIAQRTLLIRLPAQTGELAASLARVPWEIARPATDSPSLDERSLLVRLVQVAESVNTPLQLSDGECVRALFIFAEARGSRPLAARSELRQYRRLLEKEVYPVRKVVADFLSHGVTLERLRAQIEENGGYHIVHWSGHGGANLLELADTTGGQVILTGQELLDVFADAGGFIPRFVFLSACHSGEVHEVESWEEFLEVARLEDPTPKAPAPNGAGTVPEPKPGYTGIAHALLSGGVPSVVAMRYAVGDEYAREFGAAFYRALLAHKQPKTVAAAMTMARRSLRNAPPAHASRYAACDHATPVLFGAEQLGLPLPEGRSPGLDTRNPRLHRIAELTSVEHGYFVGRTWELAGLGADFIGASRGTEVRPVAVITGLGGMGKTALVAEALALWEQRFEWVLLYQAKPVPLQFEAFLSDVHLRLNGELGRYHEHVQLYLADAIHRMATPDFTGEARLERLTSNLIRALKDENIMLVLDNLETKLKSLADAASQAEGPRWRFQDPAWDRCIERLAVELTGSPSRVLITCRRPLAALLANSFHSVQLGPLSSGEAALYLREHAGLSAMIFGGDQAEHDLALRLLIASRFHPLLMDRLARLATGGPGLRTQLSQALDALESSGNYAALPELFETGPGNPAELAYLNDALVISIDQLIDGASLQARTVLWIVALADDPVSCELLADIWNDELLNAMISSQPDVKAPLSYLTAVGLVTELARSDGASPDFTCHELVRERILARMEADAQRPSLLTESAIHLMYAERIEAAFQLLRLTDLSAAQEAGRRAVVHYVAAKAYDRVSNFAIAVVVNAVDPRLLDSLLPHLQAAANAAKGLERARCLLVIADALDNSGRVPESLPVYEAAAILAKQAAAVGGSDARQAWLDYGTIVGNWSIAFQHIGEYAKSRRLQLERAEALKKAGASPVFVLDSELQALRIDVGEGKAAQAVPEIEKRVSVMEALWGQVRADPNVSQADKAHLDHLFLGALDLDRHARCEISDWERALRSVDKSIKVRTELNHPPEVTAIDRRNRAVILNQLGRHLEAKSVFEACLPFLRDQPYAAAATFSGLGDVFFELKDYPQAITQFERTLAMVNQLPDPDSRCATHHSLANALEANKNFAEAKRHRLASLIYVMVGSFGMRAGAIAGAFARNMFAQPTSKPEPLVPSVAELLADQRFDVLNGWLHEQGIDVSAVQESVDRFFVKLRAKLDKNPEST